MTKCFKSEITFVKSILLLVYAVFFIVNLWFNFDILSDYFHNDLQSVNFVTHSHQHIEKNSHSSSTRSFVRLNKRFQPESIPVIRFVISPFPVQYKNRNFPFYNDDKDLSTVFVSCSLRAPPTIA